MLKAATYYSLVGAKDAVLLVAAWHDDFPTLATCWLELDREPFPDTGNRMADVNGAWERLKARNNHLLSGQRG